MGMGLLQDCNALTELSIPFLGKNANEPTTIGYVFGTSDYYEHHARIPQTLKKVSVTLDKVLPENAFYGCYNLVDIIYVNDVTAVGSYAFFGCARLKSVDFVSTAKTVGESAFEGCNSITEISLPLVNEIKTRVFVSTGITSFSIPATVTAIEEKAFANCSQLKEVVFEESNSFITKNIKLAMGGYVFLGCNSLEILSIPNRVKEIGFGILQECYSITDVTIPFLGETIDSQSNISYLFGLYGAEWNSEIPLTLSKITVSLDTEVDEFSYYNCFNLTEIVYKKKISKIGKSAIENCFNLKSIDISAVTEMDNRAFISSGLEKITIPSSLTYIPDEAFAYCNELNEVKLSSSSSFCSLLCKFPLSSV